MKHILILLSVCVTLTTCGQTAEQKTNNQTKKSNNMDTSKLTNSTVKSAIEALQANDKAKWYSHFTTDVVFTDDGNKQNLKSFFDNAFNHKEKFLNFKTIENEGLNIVGDFYAGQWGTFEVYFNFTLNAEGKITRLDIGQTGKL